jgi:two-component system chemotaxis response regulator CheB
LVAEPPLAQEDFPTTTSLEIEANIAEQVMNTKEFLENVEQIGVRTTFTCPDCDGAIWQLGDSEPLKLRCHVGHSFTGEVFSSEQRRNTETALWTAVRIMEERVTFSRLLAARKREQKMLEEAEVYENDARSVDGDVTRVRDLIVLGAGLPSSSSGDME